MGEPAGIGGEILLKAWLARTDATPPFFAIDDPKRLTALAKRFALPCPIGVIADPEEAREQFGAALPVLPLNTLVDAELGQPRAETGAAVIASIDRALELAQSRRILGFVTNPIQKATVQSAGFAFPGHTEYLGHRAGGTPVMMLAIRELRVVPVTVHVPLARVPQVLSTEAIITHGKITARALQTDFGIARPRLAVAALNPHAGEAGTMGNEETRIIAPAVAALRGEGIDATGPAPADTLFHAAARTRFDAALCMYHDQALIPLKTIDFASGVNVTLGLPFVRTSPDHGTAIDIAAQGIADSSSLQAAVRLAAEMGARRLAA
jgi:4-hydroxythreonine-4-phosphate dehydrogenase